MIEIKIYKKDRTLELWKNKELLKKYNVGLGFTPTGGKKLEGDGKTPEGSYYICTKNEQSKFTLFLGLSYPNLEDAKIGLSSGIITEEEFSSIKSSMDRNVRPPWETGLGGKIGIHGKGSAFDWTAGCIALDDEDIKDLWTYVEKETVVNIYE